MFYWRISIHKYSNITSSLARGGGTGSYSVSLSCQLFTSSILALDIVRPITDEYSRIELKSRRTWHFMCVTSHVTHYVTKAVIGISVHPSCMALKRNKWILPPEVRPRCKTRHPGVFSDVFLFLRRNVMTGRRCKEILWKSMIVSENNNEATFIFDDSK